MSFVSFVGYDYVGFMRYMWDHNYRSVPNTDCGHEWYHYPDGKTVCYSYCDDNNNVMEIHDVWNDEE